MVNERFCKAKMELLRMGSLSGPLAANRHDTNRGEHKYRQTIYDIFTTPTSATWLDALTVTLPILS